MLLATDHGSQYCILPETKKKKNDLRKACCFGKQQNATAFVHIEQQLDFYKWLNAGMIPGGIRNIRAGGTLHLSDSAQH